MAPNAVLGFPTRPLGLLVALALTACGGGGGGSGGGDGSDGNPAAGGAVVSGSVAVKRGNVADADPARARGGSDTVVPMPNPALVGGFVAATASDDCQPSEASARQAGVDRRDRYRVVLAKGQVAQLTVPDRISNESLVRAGAVPAESCPAVGMELALEREGEGPRSIAVEPGSGARSVTLVADKDGTHTITVAASQGFGGYTLSVGSGGAGLRAAGAGDFVPGEILVRRRPDTNASYYVPIPGLERSRDASGGPRLMRLQAETPAPASVPKAAWSAASKTRRTVMMAAALRQRDDVVYAVPNYIWSQQTAPNDPLFEDQWPLMNGPGGIDWLPVWEGRGARARAGGAGTTVAVIDNGIYYDDDAKPHPDLRGQLDGGDDSDEGPPGVDFVADPNRVGDADDNPRDPPPGIYHGTHVAGIVAAATNNARGTAGTAWNARVLPLKALAGGTGTLSDVIQAMRYAAGLSTDRGPSRSAPVDVINLSLGGAFGCEAFAEEVAKVREQGVVVVSAAGNAGSAEPFCPAAAEGVVGVGAVTREGRVAAYSNRGPNVDVVAPGGSAGGSSPGVLGPGIDVGVAGSGFTETPSYGALAGTSFAAPHVAAVAALMRSLAAPDGNGGGLTPESFDCALAAGDITVSEPDWSRTNYGSGLISARRAVAEASSGGLGSETPVVLASPAGVTLGTERKRATVSLEVTCSDSAQLTSVSVSGPFEVTGFGVGRSDEVTVVAKRGEIASGAVGRGTLTVKTDAAGRGAGQRRIPLRVVRDDRPIRASAGRQAIFLVDPLQWLSGGGVSPVALSVESPQDGVYSYRLSDVPAGRYFAIASSDLDNDGFICDAAEACDGFPADDDLTAFRVAPGERAEIDFEVGYRSPAVVQTQRKLQRE